MKKNSESTGDGWGLRDDGAVLIVDRGVDVGVGGGELWGHREGLS